MSVPMNRRALGLLGAIGASLLLIALATAARASASTIYACEKKKGGSIRIVSEKAKCKKSEKKLSWNVQGPAGKNGLNGKDGTNGKNGENGKEGAPGQPQKAVAFETVQESSIEPHAVPLFELGGAAVRLSCVFFIANFNIIEAAAPSGSHATTGLVATNSENKAPEVASESVESVALTPTPTKIVELTSNVKEPYTNKGHVNGSITTPTAVVLFDAFLQTGPNPSGCTVSGVAFSIPRS